MRSRVHVHQEGESAHGMLPVGFLDVLEIHALERDGSLTGHQTETLLGRSDVRFDPDRFLNHGRAGRKRKVDRQSLVLRIQYSIGRVLNFVWRACV